MMLIRQKNAACDGTKIPESHKLLCTEYLTVVENLHKNVKQKYFLLRERFTKLTTVYFSLLIKTTFFKKSVNN